MLPVLSAQAPMSGLLQRRAAKRHQSLHQSPPHSPRPAPGTAPAGDFAGIPAPLKLSLQASGEIANAKSTSSSSSSSSASSASSASALSSAASVASATSAASYAYDSLTLASLGAGPSPRDTVYPAGPASHVAGPRARCGSNAQQGSKCPSKRNSLIHSPRFRLSPALKSSCPAAAAAAAAMATATATASAASGSSSMTPPANPAAAGTTTAAAAAAAAAAAVAATATATTELVPPSSLLPVPSPTTKSASASRPASVLLTTFSGATVQLPGPLVAVAEGLGLIERMESPLEEPLPETLMFDSYVDDVIDVRLGCDFAAMRAHMGEGDSDSASCYTPDNDDNGDGDDDDVDDDVDDDGASGMDMSGLPTTFSPCSSAPISPSASRKLATATIAASVSSALETVVQRSASCPSVDKQSVRRRVLGNTSLKRASFYLLQQRKRISADHASGKASLPTAADAPSQPDLSSALHERLAEIQSLLRSTAESPERDSPAPRTIRRQDSACLSPVSVMLLDSKKSKLFHSAHLQSMETSSVH